MVHVVLMENTVALGYVFLHMLQFSPLNTILPIIHVLKSLHNDKIPQNLLTLTATSNKPKFRQPMAHYPVCLSIYPHHSRLILGNETFNDHGKGQRGLRLTYILTRYIPDLFQHRLPGLALHAAPVPPAVTFVSFCKGCIKSNCDEFTL